MKFNLSLTRRFMIFLAGIIAVLLIGSLLITSNVVRSGFSNLFEQRLSKSRDVLKQYAQVQSLQSLGKLEAVLTSPRFLAAVSTGDYGTIHREIPVYRTILDADFVLIADTQYFLIYFSKEIDKELMDKLPKMSANQSYGVSIDLISLRDANYEILRSEIVTNDGVLLGQLIAGKRFTNEVPAQLGNLTGFEVVFSRDGEIFGKTQSRISELFTADTSLLSNSQLVHNKVNKRKIKNEELVYLALPNAYANSTVIFVGSMNEFLSPIMNKIRLFLIALSVVGGLASLLVMYLFTKKRIGQQVDNLVAATEQIAAGNMDFVIQSSTTDEFGYLAKEFEVMRSRLVTGRKELEKAHREKLASERLATTGKFVAGIIHDLKNPLAIIRSSTELLLFKETADEKITKHCNSINKQIDRMVDLTRDVLDFCRGKIRLELKQCDLKIFFDDVIYFHDVAFKKAGIALDLIGQERILVNLDSGRFRRVIDNLLNNAREALKPGDKVTIKWVLEHSKLEISVSDNGPGIPEEISETLFEPFVTSGKEEGTGLGLAVAKKIVEDHGADMSVESERDLGTTFRISLPIELVESNQTKPVSVK